MCNFFGLLPGKAPPAPDPVKTAQAQSEINLDALKQSAALNRTNQVTPFGNLTYSGTPGGADDTVTTTLSPELQKLLTGQIGISQGLTDQSLNRLGAIPTEGFSLQGAPGIRGSEGTQIQTGFGDAGAIQSLLSPSGQIQSGINLSGLPQLNTDFASQLQSSRDAAYGQQAQYLDPRFEREGKALESQLAAQGITPGSEAYNDAKRQFDESKRAAYDSAGMAAVLAGNQLQGQLFGQNLSARQQGVNEQFGLGDFANSAQAQGFGQNLASGQFANEAQQQLYDQLLGRAQFSNAAADQQFAQNQALRANDIADRERSINENLLERNQNFNELAAFLNGSPIAPNSPTFQSTPVYNAAQASPDALGMTAQNYNAAVQARAGILGSIFGGAGSAIGGFLSRD